MFAELLADGSWGRYHGPHCDGLIADLKAYHEADHVHLCSSGTAAVELALRAAGVQAGDEVILAAYDFKANFVNVLTLGAMPVLIDTLADSPMMNSKLLADAFTDRTRAVICSHLHGNMANVDAVVQAAHQQGVLVIEDACQTPGALVNGMRAGMLGDVGVLSFGGSKLLTAGRGGALLTNRPEIAQRVKLFTQRGNDAYPLSEMQAAILRPQLRQLDERNAVRSDNVRRLIRRICESNGERPLQVVLSDVDQLNSQPVFYKLAFVARNVADRSQLELISRLARAKGIALDPGFPGLHEIHSRRRMRISGDVSNASKWHHQLMTMHHPVLLGDDGTIESLAEQFNALENSPELRSV